MKITTRQSKGNQINIYADEEFLFSAPQEYWYSLHIYDGDEMSAEEMEKIGKEIEAARCTQAAFSYLARRPYSEKELRLKLMKKFHAEEIDRAVEESKNLGLLDESAYAEALAEELLRLRHYGPKRILSELLKHGIPSHPAEKAVDTLEIDVEKELASLLELKYSAALSDPKDRKKVIDSLSRMGYSYSDIRHAIENFGVSADDFSEIF